MFSIFFQIRKNVPAYYSYNKDCKNHCFLTTAGKIVLFLVLFLSSNSTIIKAEGTKQLLPASTDWGYIEINNSTTNIPFATWNGPVDYRLNFTICDPAEIVYLGFQPSRNNVYYRIKNSAGTVVMGPAILASAAGVGYIQNYTEAVTGPSTIAAGGYNPMVFNPGATGDYYIEFNAGSSTTYSSTSFNFPFFDITVTDPAKNIKLGRLWSKAWEFTTGGAANQFKATMYVYSTDGIVTSLNFNGMQPQGFAVSCNSKGCANTGSTNADRQSRVGPFAFPEYKIFLNEPDVACFPTGTFGNITNAPNITGCGGNRCINIQVDKAGQLGVLLDLNGVVGYQPGTIDRLLQINAVLGMNCVPWDGKDGLGNPVLNGVNISMQIDFYNGLTHLPLYDVENQINGFIVGLVRPAGPAPRLFWDDTQLPAPQVTNTALDGILNLTGCLPASPTGCHRWKNRGINSCVPNCPESINTWWYANIVTQNIPYTNIAIIVDANINRSGFGASNDTTGCALATPIPLHGFVNGATGGLWSSNGTGTFSPSTTSVSAFYTPSAADLAAGNVKVKLTSTGNGLCPAISDSMQIFFTPPPTANSGGNQSICKNNPNVTLNGSFTLATGVKWTGGAGAFAPNNTTKNGTYTPTATEISNGTPITLTLTTTGNGVCPAASSPMTISFTPSPVANAGSDVSICSTTSTVALSGSISNATGAAWTGAAGGSFAPSATALNCTYTLSAAEIAAGSTNITLQTTGVGNCKQVTDTMKITVIKAPTVNAGGPQSVCGNNPTVTLSGGSTNASGVTWTGGAGIYTPNANAATGTYKLTTGEVSAGGVTLTLTAAGNAPCSSVTDQAVISINASPTAVINPSAVTVCANNPSAALSAAVTVATGGTWSVGSGTFLPNTNSTSITYTPSAAEVSSGLATLIFTTTGNGNCKSASDTILISILAAPFVDAGPDQTLCGNKAVATLAGAVAGATSKSWSGGAGIFSNPGLLNATYTPTAAEISAGSVTLTLTASRASCNNVTDQVTINFTPAPTADAGGNQTLCANNASVSLNGSLTVASGAQWSGGAGSFNPSSTALNATYTPTAAEITSGVTLTLTTSGNGNCNAVSDPMSINFTPAPTVNPGATQSVCANNPTTLLNGSVTVATGGTWSGGGGTFAPDATLLNTSYIPSAAEVTAGLVTLTLTSTGNGSCNPVSGNLIIDITPKPTVNAGGDKTVCADNPSVNLSATISVAGGGIWTGGSGTFSPSASSLTTTYQPTTAEILAGSVSLTLTSTGNLNCNAESDDMTITITPAPIIDAGPDMTVCGASTSIKLNGSVQNAGGGTWSSAGNGSFSPSASTAGASYLASATDISNGSVSLTFTSSGNGFCNAVSDNMVITFTNVPNINAGPDDIVCTNKLPIHLNATGSASAWSGGTGTFSPNNSTLNGSYTPSAAEIAAGSVTLTATTAPSGACPSVSDQITYTIPAGPVINAGSPQTVCGNAASVSLAGSFSNAGGISWSSNGSGTFSPNAVSPNSSYIASAADKTAGSVILTAVTTGNGLCVASNSTVTITFTPVIIVNAGPDQTYCANKSAITLNGSVAKATGGIWSGGAGTFNPSKTALNATYTPTAGEISAGTVTLTLTSTGNGTCPAQTDQVVFTITPGPTVDAGPDQTICGDSTYIKLAGAVTVSTGGTWTKTGTGTFSPNNSTLGASYFPSAADITAGSVTFTLTTSGNGSCSAINDKMKLIISPKPTVNAGANQTVCADVAFIGLNGSVTVAAGGLWSSSGTGTFSASATQLNASYISSATDLTNGTVTLKLQSTGNGTCKAVSKLTVITITPAPAVNAGADLSVCSDVTSVNLNGSVTVATGGKWTGTGTGSFSPSATALNASYVPSASDRTLPSVTLTLTSTGNGTCNPKTDVMDIAFSPKPLVNAGSDQTVCADTAFIKLNGTVNNALGGSWSSGGSGTFFPNASTINASYVLSAADKLSSPVVLTLSSTGNGACNAVTDPMSIAISPAPTVNAGADQTVCSTVNSVSLSGTLTVAGSALWTSTGSGTFSPSASSLIASYIPSAADKSAGTVSLTLSSQGNGLCKQVKDQMSITLITAPVTDAGIDRNVCADVSGIILAGSFSSGTSATWSTSGAGSFLPDANTMTATYYPGPAELSAGTSVITLTVTGSAPCGAVTDQLSINYAPVPTVNAGVDQNLCISATGASLTGIVTAAPGGSWTSTGSGSFSPNSNSLIATYIPSAADKTAGSVKIILTSSPTGICAQVTDTSIISFSPIPVVNAGPDVSICADQEGAGLAGIISNAGGGIWSSSGTGSFAPSDTSRNASYYFSQADSANGVIILTLTSTANGVCQAVSDNMSISFTPAPTISAGPDIIACTGTLSISLNSNVTVASGGEWSTFGTGTFSNSSSTSTTYFPSAADQAAGSVILNITTTGNGSCNFYSDNVTITFGLPVVNAGIDDTVCTTNYPVQLQGNASNGTWSGGAGTFSPSATALNALYTPTVAEETAGTVSLTLTSNPGGTCVPASDQVTIVILPGPVANAGSDISVCANLDSVQLTGNVLIAGSGTWTSTGSGSFLPSAASPSAYYIPSSGDKTAGSVTLKLTTTGNGKCTAVSDNMILSVVNSPIVDAGFNQTLCANNATVKLSGTISNAVSAAWSSAGGGSFAPSLSDLNASYTPGGSDIGSGVTLTLTVPATPTCKAVSDALNINFTTAPTVSVGNDTTICGNGNALVLNGGVTIAGGGLWTSTGSGSFLPSPSVLNASYTPSATDISSGPVTLTLTSTLNGSCNPASDSRIISFDQKPSVAAGANQTVCGNNAVVTLNATFTNSTGINWASSGNGSFSPSVTSAAAFYTPSIADVAAGGATLSATSNPNGTCPGVADFVGITITPSPTASVNAGFDQIVCADITSVKLSGVITIAGGGIWTSTGSGTFSPNNTSLTASYLPSAADKGSSSVIIILTSTGNGKCQATLDSMTVTFTPAPTANAGIPQTVCGDTSGVSLTGSITVALGGKWTSTGTGSFVPNSNSLIATYIPSASDLSSGGAGLTLTTTSNGTCNPVSATTLITINKKPSVSAGADKVACSDVAFVKVTGTVQNATGGTWTSTGSGTFLPNANALTVSYVPSATDLSNTVVNLKLTTTGNNQYCHAVSDQMSITFTPVPTVSAGVDATVCADIGSVPLNGSITVASGASWSSTGSGSFSPSSSSLLSSYKPSSADINTGSVSLILTSTGNGTCRPVTDTIALTITPAPVVSTGNILACLYSTGIPLNGTAANAGGGQWSSDGSGSFSPNANTLNPTYFPSAADEASGTIHFTLTSTANGNCNPVNTTAAIALLPLPSANAGQDQYVCRNSSATLSASTAAGVSYSWKTKLGTPAGTGPVTNVTASADTTVIILIVQDSKGCSSSDTINVFAVDPVSFTISDACYTSGMSLNAHPANASSAGVYQWYLNGTILGGQNDSTIHVSKAGTYKISYTLGSCSFNATAQVIAPPSLITKRKRISCTGSALAISTLSTPSSGVSYAWSTGSTPVGGNSASVSITTLMDTTMYLVDVTSSTSLCAAHDSVMVIGINKPQPVMNDSVGCQGLAVLLNGRPSNITNLDSLNPVYSWKFNQQTLPTTNDSLSAGNAGVYYVTVTADACAGTDSAQISFNALPDSPADLVSFCSDGGSAKLDALNPGSTYLWKASLETSQIIFVSNAGTYAVAITNASHCTLKDSIKVQDLCPPTFYVPNTFTPDCSNCIDTLDRHYRVYGKHIQNLSFTVFSRWGEIIFHTNNKHDAWDGTYKGVPMPIGEYDYIYTFEGDTDEYKGPYKGKGAIMLLR